MIERDGFVQICAHEYSTIAGNGVEAMMNGTGATAMGAGADGATAPQRIISLLPSATEIVCALGLADRLVAVTHECDYPAEALTKPHITRSLLPANLSSGEIDAAVGE